MVNSAFLAALAGGALIGVAASVFWLSLGRVAGVSGMLGALLGFDGARVLRALFLAGLLATGVLIARTAPDVIGAAPRSVGALAVAGLLVGVGTRLASGCTSGHGVCGVSRGSGRSIVATVTFVITGMLTVAVLRLLGAAP